MQNELLLSDHAVLRTRIFKALNMRLSGDDHVLKNRDGHAWVQQRARTPSHKQLVGKLLIIRPEICNKLTANSKQ